MKDTTLTPGSPITWTQRTTDGPDVARTGTVIDRAPTPESKGYGSRRETPGFRVAYWVLPDEADERDLSWFVAVAKSSSRPKGVLFASWSPECVTNKLVRDGLLALDELREQSGGIA